MASAPLSRHLSPACLHRVSRFLQRWTPAAPRTGRSVDAQFADVAASAPVEADDTNKENRNGKDRDQHERLARRSGAGPGRWGGLRAGRLVRPVRGQGPRSVGQGLVRRDAGHHGPVAGSAERRVVRRTVALPVRRAGGHVERPAQVRRVLDPRSAPLEQRHGPVGRRGDRGLEAEAGPGRGHRRLRQLSARTHAHRARPGRRAAPGRLPGGARGRRTPLRRHQRP